MCTRSQWSYARFGRASTYGHEVDKTHAHQRLKRRWLHVGQAHKTTERLHAPNSAHNKAHAAGINVRDLRHVQHNPSTATVNQLLNLSLHARNSPHVKVSGN